MSFLTNFITAAEAVTGAQLGADGQKVITDAVAAAEAIDGTGAVKFSTAAAQVGTDLLTLGKDVGEYFINLAIEAAVAKINNVTAAASPTPVSTAVDPATPVAQGE